jgi:hypothetical protein
MKDKLVHWLISLLVIGFRGRIGRIGLEDWVTNIFVLPLTILF